MKKPKYNDKNTIKWKNKQVEKTEQNTDRSLRRLRERELNLFSKNNIENRLWWSLLNYDEKCEVRNSFWDTSEHISGKENYWYGHDVYIPNVVNVDGWEKEWNIYIMSIFPKNPIVRREFALNTILG